jgi:DNA-binding helix-hairpin-helix protein with protein kinase domain
MSHLLRPGEQVRAVIWNRPCAVHDHLGGGAQGEVYRCRVDGHDFALKWYTREYLAAAPRLRERLERAIREGPPSDRFLWPLDWVRGAGDSEFGYLMPLREKRFRGITAWLRRRVEPSFHALATAGFELADSFLLLHAKKGLCYRDINYNNVFFDPQTGEIRICDNDNVDINGQPGEIGGTPQFMAPEIVRGEAMPSIATDRHALAVLLFFLLVVHHPLNGKKEADIHCLDGSAMRKLYGDEPVFIFDPQDASNRPVPEFHPLPLAFWPIYPTFLRELFTRAFTAGLRDPANGRVVEGEWRAALIQTRDALMRCARCKVEAFYDGERLRATGRPQTCWNCRQELTLPARVRIDKNVVVLVPGKKLYPHHVDPQRLYDFSRPIAEVTQHPAQPGVLGLKNFSDQKWVYQAGEGDLKEVGPGENCRIAHGSSVNFGTARGEIRF